MPARYFVCVDDSVMRRGTQVGMSLEVTEHLYHLSGPRKQIRKKFLWDLAEREVVTLSIQGLDDLVEAHEITDEWQILTIACLIRICECSGNDVPQFADIAHVNATHIGIERKSPTHGSVCLLLRGESAHKILVVKRRDDKRVMDKLGFLDDPINLGLAGKVRNVEPAAADGFDVWQG